MTGPGYGPIAADENARLAPAPAGAVRLSGGVFGEWQHRNRERSLPHALSQLEKAGNLDNLRRVAGDREVPHRGPVFMDSDVYKTLEAIGWESRHGENSEFTDFLEAAVHLLESVQAPDGYLNSNFQRSDATQRRWSDPAFGHELYCLGHLIQAAVAISRARGDDRLLSVAERFVALVDDRFGADGEEFVDGHPVIEMALVELYRHTGERRYLDLALLMIDRRGHMLAGPGPYGSAYLLDDVPIRDRTALTGHAVRGLYLACGVVDCYLASGDVSLLEAATRLWDDLVARRLYLTGGSGSRHRDESIGDQFELPSERAYAETCAAIALMQWAWRMTIATGRTQYLDVLERTLYNAFAAGTSTEGTAFFYSSPLQRRPDHALTASERSTTRQPWFRTACCPPNIMRMCATLEDMVALTAPGRICLALYAAAHIEHEDLVLDVATDYPRSESVTITVQAAPATDVTLSLRMPGWCSAPELSGTDAARRPLPVAAGPGADGWLDLRRTWSAGDQLQLILPMPVQGMRAHHRVDGVRGTVAFMRGPVVYCAEQQHNEAPLDDVVVGPSSIADATVHDGSIVMPVQLSTGDELLYSPWRPDEQLPTADAVLHLRPYAEWGNGPLQTMRTWFAVSA